MAASLLRVFVPALTVGMCASTGAAQSETPTPSDTRPHGGPDVADVTMDDLDVGAVEVFALTAVEPPDAPGAVRPAHYLATLHADYQFDAGLDDGGEFSVARARVGLGAQVRLGERFGVSPMLGYQLSSYDFDNAAGLGGGEPWDNIHHGQVMAVFNYAINERWSAFGGPVLSIAGESGADVGDSVTAGGMIGVGYRVSDTLVVRVGVAATSGLEEDASVLPTAVVEWALDEHWQVRFGGLDLGATSGVGLTVTHRFDAHWSASGHVGFLQQRFRLDDSGIAPDGIGENDRTAAAVGVTWTPCAQCQLGVQVGVQFDGELSVENDNGDTLVTQDYDPSVFAGGSFVFRF